MGIGFRKKRKIKTEKNLNLPNYNLQVTSSRAYKMLGMILGVLLAWFPLHAASKGRAEAWYLLGKHLELLMDKNNHMDSISPCSHWPTQIAIMLSAIGCSSRLLLLALQHAFLHIDFIQLLSTSSHTSHETFNTSTFFYFPLVLQKVSFMYRTF